MIWFPDPFANLLLRGIGILLGPAYLFLRRSGTAWHEGWCLWVNWQLVDVWPAALASLDYF
jgi:hypothetical protein